MEAGLRALDRAANDAKSDGLDGSGMAGQPSQPQVGSPFAEVPQSEPRTPNLDGDQEQGQPQFSVVDPNENRAGPANDDASRRMENMISLTEQLLLRVDRVVEIMEGNG